MLYSKKKILFLAMAIISAVMSGCSGQGENVPDQTAEQEVNNYVTAADDVTITGEVTEIVGNRVTLRIVASGEMPEGEMHSEEHPEMPEGDRPEMPDGDRPEMPEGGRPEMPGSTRIEEAEAVYTIPVGMTIDGLSGRKNDYSGITEGMMLTLTVSSDGAVRACAARSESYDSARQA